MKKITGFVTICSLFALLIPWAAAQTFEIQGQQQSAPQKAPAQQKKSKGKNDKGQKAPKGQASAAPSTGIGWGSSIEVGRMARAAQDALKHNNPGQAATYAQRAVQAAPQNADLWFLLGYTSRLSNRLQQSLDAYQRGLQVKPGNLDGLAGMAQTYDRMGQTDNAIKLLSQTLARDPKRLNDMLVLGEIYMKSGQVQQGINVLARAESMKPSSHSELLMATGYMRLKQLDKAKVLLDQAKRRDPRNADIFRAVANYQRETHDYPGAIATLKSAPVKTPALLADMGYTYELSGDLKQAAAIYQQAAAKDPGNITLQLSAAQSLIRAGEIDKGKQYLAKAQAIDANHYRLHAILAALDKTEDREADAIREYEFAIQHLPESVPEGPLYPVLLRMNLAELYKHAGNETAAHQQLAIAEQQMAKLQVEGPQKAEFLRVRASIEEGDNNFTAAENDLKQAMALDPSNLNVNLQYATVLWKTNRKDEAKKMYLGVLARDQKNRYALEGLGYLARDVGDNKAAQEYFTRLASYYPNDYVPYLALGDMYTATRDFTRADAEYQTAYKLAPKNPTIIANGANAAIESRKLELAKLWVDRATGPLADDPHVMLERERYLFHSGNYLASSQLGYKVLAKLPNDRNASVYLGYALYNLGRYDDVLALADKYENVLPKEPNFPLLAGHVHKQGQLLDEALDDYTRAIERDPKMVEGYVNRGYVENDVQNPEQAMQDFNQALHLAPSNGVAHLGLAFSQLQLHHGKSALDEADAAERLMGQSGATHLARATAYRQMRSLDKAEKEYRVALKYAPDDLKLHEALADTLYQGRRYTDSLVELNNALALSPDDPLIYSMMAHAHAYLHHRAETFKYVNLAEQAGGEQSQILLNTGDALLALGDRNAAMDRFLRALNAPDADRVDARLAIAKVFLHEGHYDDARSQVSLAFAESRIGEASPVTADDFVQAANIFLAMNDFDLATRYFNRARDAGAGDEVTAIGLANTYLAQGYDAQAQAELASLGNPADYNQNYDYMLAMGNIYRHRQDSIHAMTAFARANEVSGEDDVADRALQEVAGSEGMQVTNKLSLYSDTDYGPVFDDTTIYGLDQRLFAAGPTTLPPPRYSNQLLQITGFKYRQNHLPLISGFFEYRNSQGVMSLPSLNVIVNHDTNDYGFNGAVNPVLHLGHGFALFNAGVQYTMRRDSRTPLLIDQNLFREFVNVTTTSFFNWVKINANAFHETGPFLLRTDNSRDVGARIEFVVGHPWGNTALVTGYQVRDLQFQPVIREFFTTSTYAGVQHQFGKKLQIKALAEYIRSWRVQTLDFAIAQAMRPAFEFEYDATPRWSVNGNFSFARGMGFHDYDNIENGIFISYQKPFRRMLNDGSGDVPIEYPLRFSLGVQQQEFFNFAGRAQTLIRPVIRLTLF